MVYVCRGCEENWDSKSGFKHKDGCENKKIEKVCMKSGKGMHVPKD